DPGCDPHSTQWLPPAQKATGLANSATPQLPEIKVDGSWELEFGSQLGVGSCEVGNYHEAELNGTLYRTCLSALPARRHEALSQGRALLHGEVRDREAQPAPRPARQAAQGEGRRLRPAAARKAEGQAHLRGAREPVTPLLRDGRSHARHHRRH